MWAARCLRKIIYQREFLFHQNPWTSLNGKKRECRSRGNKTLKLIWIWTMEKLETPYAISPHRKSHHPPHIGLPVVPPKNATNRAPPCLHLFAPAGIPRSPAL